MNRFYDAIAQTFATRATITKIDTAVGADRQAELETLLGLLCVTFAAADKKFDTDKFMGLYAVYVRQLGGIIYE